MLLIGPNDSPKHFNPRTNVFYCSCKRASYDLSLSSSLLGSTGKRSSKFGFEKKFQHVEMEIKRQSLSPSPGSYDFKDGFKVQITKKNPSTFGK